MNKRTLHTKRAIRVVGATSMAMIGLTSGAAAMAVGCSSSSSNAPTSPDAESPITNGAGGTDGGNVASSDAATDGGVVLNDAGCNTAGTLYARLGGYAGIRSAIDAVVGAEVADPDIASYFFNQVATPVPAGHPTADQIELCFSDLVAGLAGGPYAYPPEGGVSDDAGTFMCRDMTTIHQPLLLSGGTFDKFVAIAAGELATLGVCSTDVATIGGVLEGTKPAIVYAPLADSGLETFAEAGAAAAVGDAGGQ